MTQTPNQLAEAIWAARQAGRTLDAAATIGTPDLATAYAIQRALLGLRLAAGELGARAREAGPLVVEALLADEALLLQVLGALQLLLFQLQLGAARGHHGAELALVEPHQHCAARDILAFAEADFHDAAGDLRADGDRLVGAQAADRADLVGRRRGAGGSSYGC